MVQKNNKINRFSLISNELISKSKTVENLLLKEVALDFVNHNNNIEACSCRCVSHCSCDCDRCSWHTLDA